MGWKKWNEDGRLASGYDQLLAFIDSFAWTHNVHTMLS